MTYVAVIPTYRPAQAELERLLAGLRLRGVPVLVADDASPCTYDVVLRDAAEQGAALLRHATNAGIARSLNAGLDFARISGARWLLTVDQDSMLSDDYLDRLVDATHQAVARMGEHVVGAVAAGSIDDASGRLSYPSREVSGLPVTEEVIQTGTLWSVASMDAIGGFDETLGIDGIDAAACVRLRAAGRRIVLVPGIAVGHRVGDGRQVSLLGRTVLASGHGPERRTTIVRNRLRLAPEEFQQSPVHAFRTLRRVAVSTLLAVTVEDDRWAKAKASARGALPQRHER